MRRWKELVIKEPGQCNTATLPKRVGGGVAGERGVARQAGGQCVCVGWMRSCTNDVNGPGKLQNMLAAE